MGARNIAYSVTRYRIKNTDSTMMKCKSSSLFKSFFAIQRIKTLQISEKAFLFQKTVSKISKNVLEMDLNH